MKWPHQAQHLTEVKQTWLEHFIDASWIGIRLIYASLSVFIHAIHPDLCSYTASAICTQIAQQVALKKTSIQLLRN